MASVHLEHLSWKAAESVLRSGRTVLIPLGARLKEHGHHLPLNNDWLIAEYLARRVAAAADVIVVPTVQYGYFPAFVEYPGSVSTSRETCRDLIVDICRSLARHGAPRFYILNTGISTNWSLEPARQQLAVEGILMEFTDLHTVGQRARASVRTQAAGTHADEIETSMMLYLAPEVVDMSRAEPDIHEEKGKGPLRRDPDATTGLYSPTGAYGDPTRATREKGEVVIEATVAEIVAFLGAFVAADHAPEPPRQRYL